MRWRNIAAAAMIAALTGCSLFATATVPTSARGQLFVLEVSYAAGITTADSLVQAGIIPKESWDSLAKTENAASASLDAADAAVLAGDPKTITGALSAAQIALNALTVYLQEAQNAHSTSSH